MPAASPSSRRAISKRLLPRQSRAFMQRGERVHRTPYSNNRLLARAARDGLVVSTEASEPRPPGSECIEPFTQIIACLRARLGIGTLYLEILPSRDRQGASASNHFLQQSPSLGPSGARPGTLCRRWPRPGLGTGSDLRCTRPPTTVRRNCCSPEGTGARALRRNRPRRSAFR